MTPEIIARVDAWLASHRDWVSASRDRQQLYCEWRLRSQSWRQLAEGSRAGAEAAMQGVLLALVREAWGDQSIHAMPSSLRSWFVWDGASVGAYSPHLGKGDSEPLALLSALEAAPR